MPIHAQAFALVVVAIAVVVACGLLYVHKWLAKVLGQTCSQELNQCASTYSKLA